MSRNITFNQILSDEPLFLDVVKSLKKGGIIAFPTDTIYGLGVDSDSKAGVEALYKVKGREKNKPLIVFLSSIENLFFLSIFPSPRTMRILRRYWPGSLTGVFLNSTSKLKAFNNSTLGVRVPKHDGLINFLKKYPGFLLTTSANRSGKDVLKDPDEIEFELGREIDFIIDGGQVVEAEPSSVIDFSIDPPEVLRKGKISLNLEP
ncbi:MAG: threonylcarbamoyl-AMP synthase [Candidatus Riflebacteria bacterium]|nr:threonylcarbamoyl-AMP synthase [Candidatus Riflebacteria bacterium]